MTEGLKIAIAGIISAGLGSFVMYLFARKKNKAETLGIEIDNMSSIIEIWKKYASDLEIRVDKVESELKEVREEMARVKDEYENKCDTCTYKIEYKKVS